ncbi:MAG TPA: DNA-formamidopyrimidine glycosylase family protein [Vicinamibacterales bacterium]|nr:DNA-formamidopyrimidine glycosylase family protein [Vicinamibacterales bacterium]
MPELPDVELYLHALRPRIVGRRLNRVRIASPFLLRTVDPPLQAAEGRVVRDVSRLGKRVVWHLDDDVFVVIHLMVAGRFRWKPPGASIPGKVGLAAFEFENGTLLLTEAGAKRRASLHLASGRAGLEALDPGGIDVLTSSVESFGAALRRENHTLKRALTDPRLLSGIGNAYSDEILHAARLSPMQLTTRLGREEIARLHAAAIAVLTRWRDALIAETGDAFPEKVTAFREGMAAHGRFGQPCPVCGTPIQRIRYAANEANYCPACQTGGKLLADRSLSRLLREDWPRSLEEMEQHLRERRRE